MTTSNVTVTAVQPPSIEIEVEHEGDTPTDDEVYAEMEAVAQQVNLDGYLAEFMVNNNYEWKVWGS